MRLLAPALALASPCCPPPRIPALPTGRAAPDFSTSGALAGRPFQFNLRERCATARSSSISIRAPSPRAARSRRTLSPRPRADFRRAGAQVIGLSADNYDLLRRFSVEACRNAFPVAMASRAIDPRL